MAGKGGFMTVADILSGLFPEAFVRGAGAVREWKNSWTDIVGQNTARHTRPVEITAGVLRVEADNAVWIAEIGMRKKEILERIRRVSPDPAVTDLSFRIKKQGAEKNEQGI